MMIDRQKHLVISEPEIEEFLSELKPMERSILEGKIMGFDSLKEAKEYVKSAIKEAECARHRAEEAQDRLDDAINLLKEWLDE